MNQDIQLLGFQYEYLQLKGNYCRFNKIKISKIVHDLGIKMISYLLWIIKFFF